MNRPRDLGPLLTLAERRRDEAAQALAHARRERASAEAQMQQLQAYTRDADARWRDRTRTGVTPTLMATHRQFMLKLEDAVRYQTEVLQQLDGRIGQLQAALAEAERELATLQRVQQRWLHDWQHRQQRLEQKATDEMAATLHRRRHSRHPEEGGPR
ncbi:MAG: flagellar export protein FliJ [Tepidimonas taiwanensis]|nr:flagellar export protein FliJ [Tepidimonas taiwanensis]